MTSVTHREEASWRPLTVVGRPLQEDTTFGQLTDGSDDAAWRLLRARRGRGGRAPAPTRGRERALFVLYQPAAAGPVDDRKRRPGFRAVPARQVPLHRCARGRAEHRADARPCPPPGESRLRSPLPDPHHDRYSRLLRKPPKHRIQARGRLSGIREEITCSSGSLRAGCRHRGSGKKTVQQSP